MLAPRRDSPRQPGSSAGEDALGRFSLHGVRSILATYLLGSLLYPQRDARALFHAFAAAVYLAPLVGGWIADRLPGRRRGGLWISVASVIGPAVIALWDTRAGLLFGLLLVAAGAAGAPPRATPFAGEPFGARGQAPGPSGVDRRSGSLLLGTAAAYLLVPWFLRRYGPTVAFAVPAAAMALSLAVRVARREGEAPPGRDPHGFWRVMGHAARGLGTLAPGRHWLDAARERHPAEAVEGAKAVFRILAVFAAMALFWALFDQRSSSWVIQAREMDLQFGTGAVAPEQLQAASPLLALVLFPLLSRVVFPQLERRGVALTAARKMTAGLLATGLSFAAAAIVQAALDGGGTPSMFWQLPQYVLLTAGEVLVCVTGLELGRAQVPPAMWPTLRSMWLLAVSLGNVFTAVVARLVPLEGAAYFWLFAALSLGAAVAFRWLARGYGGASAPAAAAE